MRIGSNFNNLSSLLQSSKAAAPANIPIEQELEAQQIGQDQGSKNAQDAINLGNVAEGALNSASDSLQQIRELAVQAGNGALSSEDRSIIQDQINGLKQDIQSSLQNSEFNGQKLLDGGFNGNIQTGGNPGQGRVMQIENTSLDSLGITNFDVTGSFDIGDIDNAIEQVNANRSQIGAQTNGLESTIRSNEIARENTLASQSNLTEDLEESITQFRQGQLQQSVQTQTQLLQQQAQESQLDILG